MKDTINRPSPDYRAGYLEALAAFGSILNVHATTAPRDEIPGLEAASRVAAGMYQRTKEEWEGGRRGQSQTCQP